MRSERSGKRRQLVLLVLLALFVSHGLVYLWAKQRHAAASGDGVSVREVERALPGKSAERGPDGWSASTACARSRSSADRAAC